MLRAVALLCTLLVAAPAWAEPERDAPAASSERPGLCARFGERLQQLRRCLAHVPQGLSQKLQPLTQRLGRSPAATTASALRSVEASPREGRAAEARVPRACLGLAAGLARFRSCLARVPAGLGERLRPLAERLEQSKDAIWAGSAASLGTAEFAGLSESAALAPSALTRTLGRQASHVLGSGLRALGLAGSGALLISGASDLRQAKTPVEKLDASSDIAWGVQGLASLAAPTAQAVSAAVPWVGAVGAACQVAAGCKRICEGHKEHDRSKMKLGALDVASGSMWLAWDVAGCSNPAFLAAYAGTMVAREAYANRETIKRFGAKACAAFSSGLATCRAQLSGFANRSMARAAQPRPGSSLDEAFARLRREAAPRPGSSLP